MRQCTFPGYKQTRSIQAGVLLIRVFNLAGFTVLVPTRQAGLGGARVTEDTHTEKHLSDLHVITRGTNKRRLFTEQAIVSPLETPVKMSNVLREGARSCSQLPIYNDALIKSRQSFLRLRLRIIVNVWFFLLYIFDDKL